MATQKRKIHDRRAKRYQVRRSLLLQIKGVDFTGCLDTCAHYQRYLLPSTRRKKLTHRQKVDRGRIPTDNEVRAAFNKLVRAKTAKLQKRDKRLTAQQAKKAAIALVERSFGNLEEMLTY